MTQSYQSKCKIIVFFGLHNVIVANGIKPPYFDLTTKWTSETPTYNFLV